MRDLFDILGLPTNALGSDVRRACARRPRSVHPDFHDAGVRLAGQGGAGDAIREDLAIDFIDITPLVGRIQLSFFSNGS